MDTNDLVARQDGKPKARSGCLVEGCPCQDTRIVSHRRAKFYAHLAVVNGETAERFIQPDPGWALPRPRPDELIA